MTIEQFRKYIRHVSGKSTLVYFADTNEYDNGETTLPGIGYFDAETKELYYIGPIPVVTDDEDLTV